MFPNPQVNQVCMSYSALLCSHSLSNELQPDHLPTHEPLLHGYARSKWKVFKHLLFLFKKENSPTGATLKVVCTVSHDINSFTIIGYFYLCYSEEYLRLYLDKYILITNRGRSRHVN